jgi:hypothetical protein
MKKTRYNLCIRGAITLFLFWLLPATSQTINAQNYALSFDGSGDYINFGNPEELRISGSQTIEMWLYPFATDARRNPMAKAYGGEGTITFETSGELSYYYGTNGGNGNPYQGFNNEFPININEWTHIAVVRDLTNMKLHWYINGILVNSVDASYSYATKGGNSFYIGRGYVSDFKGIIDDVRVWNVARAHSEIALYKNVELTGSEPGLAAYWDFNEGAGSVVYDKTQNNVNGNTAGNTSYTTNIPPVFQYSPGNEIFQPVSPTGLPYSIILSQVLLNGSPVPLGTQIGVFDGELCVGTAIYDGTPNQALVAWQQDDMLNLEGFVPGNTMQFKYHTYWYSEIKNFDASPEFSVGNGTFGDGPYSVAGLSATTDLAPDIALSVEVLNFNALMINQSDTLPLIVTNQGSAILHVQSFQNSDGHFSFTNSPMFLQPGGSDTLLIAFMPTEVVAYSDVLQITSDDPETPVLEIPLHGLGLPLQSPQVTLSPTYLNFEGIPVNTSKTLTLNILNFGNGTLQVTGIGSSNGAFGIVGSGSFSLAQGQNRNVEVQFSPDEPGAYQGNLTIQTNSGNLSVPVSGVASHSHFTGVNPTGLPYPIIVEDVNVDGFRPAVGDEVAVFDDTLCVGVGNLLNCKSVSFDGSGDYINADQTTYPQMTMEVWAKIDQSETNGEIVGFTHTNADQHYGFSFRIYGDNLHAKAATNNDAYFYNNVFTNISGLKGDWAHFAMTWENLQGTTAEVKLFVNGQVVDSDIHTFPSSPYDPTVPYPYPFSMGGCYANSQTRMFTGMVDEVRVWNVVRDGSEIQADMNRSINGNEPGLVGYWNFDDNTANDLTSFGNHGTMHGNATIINDCQVSDIHITAWEKDDMLGYPGFTAGNPMSFKVFTEIYDNWVEVDATADFSIGNGNFGNGPLSVLTLQGTSGLEPDIDVPVENLYVAQLTLGESATKAFPIMNTGNAPLHISVSENSNVFSSSVAQATIQAGDSVMCEITFTPNQVGGFTSELIIQSNDPDEDIVAVSLEGFALPAGAANISTSVDHLNFGNVEIDSAKTFSFFVINTGTTQLTVSGITSDNPEYSASPETFTLENTNDLKEVLVNFTPVTKGISSATLTISSNANQKQLSLIGVGVENHFDVVEETGLPYYIIVEETNLDDFIKPGDELAVFDGDLCVGEALQETDNKSAQFDGSGDYIVIPSDESLDVQDFTIECFVKTTTPHRDVFMRTNNNGGNELNLFLYDNANEIHFLLNDIAYDFIGGFNLFDNNWHHIAVTYNSSKLRCYVDGIACNNEFQVSANLNFGTGNALIGADYDTYNGTPNDLFIGEIDEVRFWNYERSLMEIHENMSQKLSGNESGLIGYWDFEGDTYTDKSTYNNDGIMHGDVNVGFFGLIMDGPMSLVAWQKDDAQGLPGFTPGNPILFKLWTEINGIPSELSATPTYLMGNGNFGDGDFTVATLDFNLPEISIEPEELFVALEEPDSTEKTITISNPGNGELQYNMLNTPLPGGFSPGNSLTLDGNNDYVTVPNKFPELDEITLECWIYPESSSGANWILSTGRNGSTPKGGFNFYYSGNALKGGVWREDNGQIFWLFDAPNTIQANQWQHVAMTYNGRQIKLFVNGQQVGQSEIKTYSAIINGSQNLKIGVLAYSVPNYYDFNGQIDELRIWDFAKSQTEIQQNCNISLTGNESGLLAYWNFNDGNVTDLTPNGNDGIFEGNASATWDNAPLLNWLRISPLDGTIPPDGSENIIVEFYSEGLNDGLYEAAILLKSNTINNPIIEIPVSMNVTGNPQITASDTLLDFENIGVLDTASLILELKNIGSKNLNISEMYVANQESTGFDFEIPQSGFPLTLAPAETYDLNISFTPLVSGIFNDSLFIVSNAENADTLPVKLKGTGITPPEIIIEQTFYNYSLACNGNYTDSLLIKNNGEEKLFFETSGSLPWLSTLPAADSVPGGDSLWLTVNITTLDLFAGVHSAVLSFSSNDPVSPLTEVFYQLNVFGEPEILATDFIDLGIAYVGDTLIGGLLVANNGCDTLQINNVIIQNQQQVFVANNPAFNIAPGNAQSLQISFIPQSTFQYTGIINILSNDPNNPQFQVVVSASGIEPPEMNISPLDHSLTIQSGDIDNVTSTVLNSGGETLIFDSEVSGISSGMIYLDGVGDYINVVHNDLLNPTDGFTFEAWLYLHENTNEFIVGKENTGKGNYRLFVNGNHRFEFELNKNNILISQSYAAKNQWLHVAASFDGEWMKIFINGILDNQKQFDAFTIQANTANFRIGRSYQYEYFDGKMDEIRLWNIARNESEIQSVMNQALTGNETELVLYFPFSASVGNIVNDASLYGNNGILYGNPSRQTSTIPFTDYLAITNPTGFLSAGQTQNLNMEINTVGILANDYYREVHVSSNAIENPVDTISLDISIQGGGIVTHNPAQLQFDNIFVGLSDTLELIIINTGASTAGITDISFSSDAFYAIHEIEKVFPFSQKNLMVVFEPALVQQYEEVLTIDLSNANPGQIAIPLSGLGLAPPVPVFNPGSVDFGEVVINLTGTESVALSNLGSSTLEVFNMSLSNSSIFNTNLSLPLSLDFEETAIFEVSFTPKNYNVAEGEMVFSTNIGEVHLPLTGVGTPPNHDLAVVEIVSPVSWCGMGETEQLTVKIQNFGVLDQSEFEIVYSLNGGNTVAESINSLLSSGDVMEFSFDQGLDFSILGSYDLQVFTSLPNDENTSNDTLLQQIINSPVVGQFTNLLPADSSFGVIEPVSFSWNNVPNATHYDLYIWRTNQQKPNAPTIAGIVGTGYTYYDYLNKNYLYNWQVVAKNQCSETESNIQLFSFNVFSDLTISEIVIPDSVFPGESVQLTYTVSNIGIGGTGLIPWQDDVFISGQPVFNPETAINVAQVSNLSPLSSGQHYTHTLDFEVPDYFGGAYYAFVQTDINNKIQETNEDNNSLASENPMQIILPPYPDLLVSGVQSVNFNIVPGGTISAGWNVENVGDADAIGGWSQRVSLIAGQQRKILGYVQYTGTLNTGGIMLQNASFEIPDYPGMDGEVFIEVLLTPYPALLEIPGGEQNNLALSTESITLEKVISISSAQQTINEDAANPLQVYVFRSGFVYDYLDVNISLSDTSRVSAPDIVTIPAGQSGKTFNLNVINNDDIDGNIEIEITAEANSYGTVSTIVTIIDDEVPSLALNLSVDEAGEGAQFDLEIVRDFVTDEPLVVQLFSSNDSQLELPDEVTIEANEASATINVEVSDDNIPELNTDLTISATAPGYNSGIVNILIIDDDIPQIELTINPDSVSESGGPFAAWGTLTRVEAGEDPVTVLISASVAGQLFFPTQVFIPGNVMEKQFMISVYDNSVLDGNREIELEAAIYISSCGCGVPEESGGTDVATITIIDDDGPALSLEADPAIVAEAVQDAGKLIIKRNTLGGGQEVQVTLSHDRPDEIVLPATAIIPEGLDEVEVFFSTLDDGLEDGEQVVSVSVSAEGYSPGSCWIVVSDRNIPDFTISDFELSANEIFVGDSVDVSIEVKNIGFAPAPSGARVNIYKSSDNVLGNGDVLLSTTYTTSMLQIGETEILSHTLNFNENVEDFYLFATVNKDESLTELVTVNNQSEAKSFSVLPDYTATAFVEGEVFNGLSPITITGVAEMASKTPAANKPVDVYVIVNGVRRVYKVSSDENGEFGVVFIPLNGEAGDYTVGACYPNLVVSDEQDSFVLLGAKHTATDFIIWELHEGETQQKNIEIKNFSSLPLSNVQVEILSSPQGCNLNFTPIPSLQGNVYGTINCTVNATEISNGNYYEEVELRLVSSEGTQYDFSAWFYCFANTGNLKLNPVTLNESMVTGQLNYVEFEVTNNGLDETGLINIDLPEAYWLDLACPDTISSLPPGQSAVVTLKLLPGDDLQLNNPITGSIVLSGSNSNSVSLPFTFMPISEETGDLLVDVVDEYTYNTQAAPHLEGATVVVSHPYTGQIIAQGTTDVNGHFLVEDINEGYYTLKVEAPMHSSYQDYIYIEKGTVNQELVFIGFQAITYSWNVVPTVIEDEYEITLEVEYETNVPVPIVLMDMPGELPHLEEGEFFPFILTLTNVGMITAEEVEVIFPEDEEYMFTANMDIVDILPQQSIQIPVVMELRPPEEKSEPSILSCIAVITTKFEFQCGPDGQMRYVSAISEFFDRQCDEIGGPPGTNTSFPILQQIPNFSQNNGSGSNAQNQQNNVNHSGPILPLYHRIIATYGHNPYRSNNQGCDPCLNMALNSTFGMKSPLQSLLELIPVYGGVFKSFDCLVGVISSFKFSYDGFFLGLGGLIDCGLSAVFGGFYDLTKDMLLVSVCKLGQTIANPSSAIVVENLSETEQIYYDMIMMDKAYTSVKNWTIEQFDSEELIEKEFFDLFMESVADFVDNQISIDTASQNEILDNFIDTDITESEIIDYFDYWNTTLQARDSGIYSPTPEFPNIIDTLVLHHHSLVLDSVMQYVAERGFPSIDSLYKSSITLFASLINEETSAVCASVSVQFSQTLTMTREAFEGTLSIFNGHETDAMENINLNLEIYNEDGELCNDLFEITTLSLNQITGIDGTGILEALETGEAVIRFIPERGAAPEIAQSYSFGGTLSYYDPFNSEVVNQILFPVVLQVNPSPDLYIDYFMQRDIYGDDALTEPIEPMIPAELAVMIDNRGAGTAWNVTIESAQPEIIENEKGLLIDFEIVGSNLGGEPTQLGLFDIDFGNIHGGEIQVGQWWFTSTLLGHFISYDVSVNHLDSYGNPDLSLISEVNIHELIKGVTVYGAFNDSIGDFLVNDIPDVDDLPDALYYSNGIVEPVAQAESASVDAPVSLMDTIVQLSVTPSSEGWNYTKIDDPGNGLYRIVSITRNDGQEIPLTNIWLTYSTIPDGGEPIYENKLHFTDRFEIQNNQTYTLVFEPIDQDFPEVVAINNIPETPIDYPLQNVEVVFSEPIEPSTFTYEDMTLKNQGGPNLMDSLVGITQVNDSTFDVDISVKTAPNGYYTLTVQASGVADLVGNYGTSGVQAGWLQSVAAPAIDYFFGLPETAGEPIDTLLVLFNMPINLNTFTTTQLILKDSDGNTLPTGSLEISSVSYNDVLFKISGLEALTSADGNYELIFKLTEIQGENGQVGFENQAAVWGVCQIDFPTADAGGDASICFGQSYQLNGSVANASSFFWTTDGDGSFDNSQILNASYTPGSEDFENGYAELMLTAMPLNECAAPATSSLTIYLLQPPNAFAGNDFTICQGTTHQLYGTVENSNGYFWITNGDGNFNNANILTPVYIPGTTDITNGFAELSLIASPHSPCDEADTSMVTVYIQGAPIAMAGQTSTVCENQDLNLNASAENYSELLWISTGDGEFSSRTILNPVYSFGNVDIDRGFAYLILMVHAVDPCFQSAFSTVIYYVDRLPLANAGADASICEMQSHQLNGSVEYSENYTWTTAGDGVFSNDSILNPVYTPGLTDIQNGSVQLTLSALPSNSCTTSDHSSLMLTIVEMPIADAGNDATICEDETHQLNGAIENASDFLWITYGTGQFDNPGVLNPVFTPGANDIVNGSVIISLVAQPISPCVFPDNSQITLTIVSNSTVDAGSDNTICETDTYHLSGTAENADSIEWQTAGDGTFDDETALTAIYTPGTADIAAQSVALTLYGQPLSPCTSLSSSQLTLTVIGLPTADAGNNQVICEDQNAQLSGIVENAFAYLWQSFGDGVFDDDAVIDPVYTPGISDIANGSVEVSLTAQPLAPCTLESVSTLSITLRKNPTVSAGNDQTVCHQDAVTVSATAGNTSAVLWQTSGDGTFANATAIATTYFPGGNDISAGTVQLTITGSAVIPCLVSATDAMDIVINYCQDIVIPSGWSGISTYVDPFNPNPDSLFDKVMEDLIILQSQTGVYWPGQNVNTIGQWSSLEGYSIKMQSAVNLEMVGSRTSSSGFALSSGWSIMPVLSECPVDVAELFTATGVKIVKEVAGWQVYWPEFAINTLEALQPGKAYFALMENGGEIEFPACNGMKSGSARTLTGFETLSGLAPWKLTNPTAISHNIAVPATANNAGILAFGDIIGIFDISGNCNGVAEWTGTNTVITAFGDDPMTAEKDGFVSGEAMIIKSYNPETEIETILDVEFSYSMPHNEAFTENGLSAISSIKSGAIGIENTGQVQQVQIVPNPAKDAFTLYLDFDPQQKGLLELYNLKGQLMKQLEIQDKTTKVEIADLPAGVYVANIQIDNQIIVKQIIKH